MASEQHKPVVSGAEIARDFFFDPLKREFEFSFPNVQELFPTECQIPPGYVPDEWLFLEIFTVDFVTYLALGQTTETAAVLTPFWQSVKEWLQEVRLYELPDRLAVVGGGPRTLAAEPAETAYQRLTRRANEYTAAVATPHRLGENYSVAAVFAGACGFFDATTVTGITAFFSRKKIEYANFLRSAAHHSIEMIKRLELDEMDLAAAVRRNAFDERLPWLVGLHSAHDDRRHFRERVFSVCTVWGAFESGILVGIIAFRAGWIDHLYVLPCAQGRGYGSALLKIPQANSDGLSLWTFQRNMPARRFYETRGFTIVRETDGSGNEEHEPDVLYQWRKKKD